MYILTSMFPGCVIVERNGTMSQIERKFIFEMNFF